LAESNLDSALVALTRLGDELARGHNPVADALLALTGNCLAGVSLRQDVDTLTMNVSLLAHDHPGMTQARPGMFVYVDKQGHLVLDGDVRDVVLRLFVESVTFQEMGGPLGVPSELRIDLKLTIRGQYPV